MSAMDQQHSAALTEQVAAAATLQQEMDALETVQMASQLHILQCLCDTSEHCPGPATYLIVHRQGQQLAPQVSQQLPQGHTTNDLSEEPRPCHPSKNLHPWLQCLAQERTRSSSADERAALLAASELHLQRQLTEVQAEQRTERDMVEEKLRSLQGLEAASLDKYAENHSGHTSLPTLVNCRMCLYRITKHSMQY